MPLRQAWSIFFYSEEGDRAGAQRTDAERQMRQRKRQRARRRGRKKLPIALSHASLNFSGELAIVQIVCDGDDRQKNRREHDERHYRHAQAGQERCFSRATQFGGP